MKTHAFSLVELSIVLVILGLLVGGILAGQSLIRAAELRSVSTQFQNYQAAIYGFRDKYLAMPGDIANATRFWGDDVGVCPDAAVADGSPGTCNGDGDGIITWPEGLRAWQHMAAAGMIEGRYSGLVNPAGTFIGGSVPAGKISSSGYQFWSEAKSAQGWTGGDAANTLQFIRFGGVYTLDPPVRISILNLKSEEAWNIDTKLDDGRPGFGKVFVYNAPGACNDTGVTTTAVYLLSASGLNCMIHMVF